MNVYTIEVPGDFSKYELFQYPAGEYQVRLKPSQIKMLEEADEIRVVVSPRRSEIGFEKIPLMELCLLTDALRHPNYLGRIDTTLVLNYLSYSRADRRFVEGDCFGLKIYGQIINSLCYNKVVTIDAHSSVAKKCIANLVDISPRPLVEQAFDFIQHRNPSEEATPVILLPDKGAFKRYNYQSLGKVLHCEKKRDPATGKLSGFEVPPKEKFGKSESVLIVDDICDGGGTFIGIADALAEYNLDKYLYVTHGIFSKGFKELQLRFKKIFTSDSFPSSFEEGYEDVKVFPTAQLL
jgi:ribose-phosphate pyrophosphokinase